MKRMGKAGACLLVGLLVLALAPLGAQELRGRIGGTVRDNTGGVLPGVTITAQSSALIQPQVTVSGADGGYSFPSLPPGLYTVTYELSGFQTLRREEIRVNLNVTVTLNAELGLAGVEETLTITGESPVVDVKTTTTAVNFTEELLEDIPNARDIWAAMAQAPGFQMLGYDVGGSHAGTQTGYQTYGYNDQNRTLVEGINVTEGTGGNAGYFDYGSFEEYQLGGAGNNAETHGLGAFHNLTVKSGGDEFGGDIYFDYEDESTIGDNLPSEFTQGGGSRDGFKAPSSGLSNTNNITEQTDLNLGVGGPVWKGKAWFYGGYRRNNQFKFALGLPDPSQTELVNYTLKGTVQLNTNNQIIAFYNYRTKLQAQRGLSLATPVETSWYQASVNKPKKIEWTSVLSDAAFLDVQYSHWSNSFPLFPQDTKSESVEGVAVGRTDRATGQQQGAQSYYHLRDTLKPQFHGTLSYYKDDWNGSHNFKFGTEILRERRQFLRMQPGNIYYWDRGASTEEVDIYNTPNEGINDATSFALHASDSWTVNDKLTLNLALRFDNYRVGWPEQSYTPEQTEFFEPVTVAQQTTVTFNSFGPRLGMAYDLSGEGRTVLKAFWGRFYYSPSTSTFDDENPVGQAARRFAFNDLNGNKILDPGPDGTLINSPELGDQIRTLGGAGFVRVDRDVLHARGDEFSTHIEHEMAENLSIRGSYVYKNARNNWAEVDMNRAFAYTIPFEYNDVGADNTPGTGDDQVISLLDREPGVAADRVFTTPGEVGLDPYNQDYHTMELTVNRRFKDNWLFLTSYMYTWANDHRSESSSTGSTAVARNGTAYRWQPNRGRFGQQDSRWWNFKMVGRYIFPYDIGVSASYKLQSGYNFTRRLSVPLPNAGTETVPASPIADEAAPNVGIFDIRLEKAFDFGGRRGRLTGILDIFNLTNSNPVSNFRTISGSRYKEVIAILDPRVVRFGVRYEF